MKILLGCEESQAVCIEFRKRGHDAYSCDTRECSGGYPEWHIQCDVLEIINGGWFTTQSGVRVFIDKWDLGIFFPPCTRLTNSVWWYIKRHNLYKEMKDAAAFFNALLDAPIEKVCMENPVQHGEARKLIRKYDQTIQPYNFGDDASKKTCLWLENLPPLENTGYVEPRIVNGKKRWSNQTDGGWNRLLPSDDRGFLRSKTFPGIAEAFADQWGN